MSVGPKYRHTATADWTCSLVTTPCRFQWSVSEVCAVPIALYSCCRVWWCAIWSLTRLARPACYCCCCCIVMTWLLLIVFSWACRIQTFWFSLSSSSYITPQASGVRTASQLVTRPTRHTVKSSHCSSQLVTQSQASRHKLTHTSKLTWHFPRNIRWL